MADTNGGYTLCLAGLPVFSNEAVLQSTHRQDFYKIYFIKHFRYYFINDITAILFTLFCFSTLINTSNE